MSIETMKLALDALEEIHVGNMTPMAETNWNKAITALRQAIEQAEKQEPVAWICSGELFWNQEYQVIAEQGDGAKPLYTAPPRKEWVGLTDEDIAEGQKESWVDKQAFESAVWWAEAKLKEKNT